MAMESLSLKGLRALVTGAGTGIGKQIALGFAEAGAEVIFVGRRLEPLEKVAALAKEKYGTVGQCVAADITSAEDCERLGREAGRVDILCNNAGASIYGKWDSISMEDWRQVFAVNVEGPWRLSMEYKVATLRSIPEWIGISRRTLSRNMRCMASRTI